MSLISEKGHVFTVTDRCKLSKQITLLMEIKWGLKCNKMSGWSKGVIPGMVMKKRDK